MASGESKRLALVVGGGLVIGLGLAAVYFLVVSPRQQRSTAAAQIATWDEHWRAAQACLFGSARRGTDLADAIALAPFDDSRPDDSECNRRIGKLSRPEGPATTLDDVESAWTELEARAVALARRYGAFVSSPTRERAGLAAAAADLDSAHDRLRTAAGLAAIRRAVDGTAIRSLQPVRVSPVGAPLELAYRRFGDGVVQVQLASPEASYDLAIRGPDQVTTRRLDAGTIRSYPGGSWGAVVGADDSALVIRAGAVDAGGAIAARTEVARGDEAALVLAAALGDGADRVLVGGDAHRARVFRSRDSGATWTGADLKGAARVHAHPDPIAAALDLFWRADGGGWRWTRFEAATAAALPEVVDLDIAAEKTCADGASRWSIAGRDAAARLVRLGAAAAGGKVDVAAAGAAAVIACTAAAALVATEGGFLRCSATACTAALAGVPAGARADAGADRGLALIDDQGARFATQRGDVIGIWSDDGTATFVRIPDASRGVGLVRFAAVPHVLLWGDPGLTVAAIP